MTVAELFLKYDNLTPTSRPNLFIVSCENEVSSIVGLYDTTAERFIIPFGDYNHIANAMVDGLFDVGTKTGADKQPTLGVFDVDSQTLVLPVQYKGDIFSYPGGYFAIQVDSKAALYSIRDESFIVPFEAGFHNFETMEWSPSVPMDRFLSFSKNISDESEVLAVFDCKLWRMVVPEELGFDEVYFLTPTLFEVRGCSMPSMVGLHNTKTGKTTWKKEREEDKSLPAQEDDIPF